MISPWTIYWIMQLDSINTGLNILSFLTGGLVVILSVASAVHYSADPAEWASKEMKVSAERANERAPKIKTFAVRIAVFAFLPSFFLGILLPSSKVAAAMVLIPAIANNETVQKEAGELYQLAKDGLKELVKPDEPKK